MANNRFISCPFLCNVTLPNRLAKVVFGRLDDILTLKLTWRKNIKQISNGKLYHKFRVNLQKKKNGKMFWVWSGIWGSWAGEFGGFVGGILGLELVGKVGGREFLAGWSLGGIWGTCGVELVGEVWKC